MCPGFFHLKESDPFHDILNVVESCDRLFTYGRRANGFYNLLKSGIAPVPKNQSYIRVWCDFDGPNGGWILLQERSNATFNFYRSWDSYEKGFGEPGVAYWLGNIYIHSITFKRNFVLRIELPGYSGEQTATLLAEYDNFQVLSPSTGYTLRLGSYRRGLSDILNVVNNSAFSTWDRDNDEVDEACVRLNKGAWWYGKTCYVYDMHSMLGFLKMKMRVKEPLKGNVLQSENYGYEHLISFSALEKSY